MADDPVAEALAKRQRDIVAEALARRAQPTAPANPTNSVTGAQPMRGAPSFLGAHPPANADEVLTAGLNRAPRPRVSPAMTSPAGAVLAVGRELVRTGAQDPMDVPRQIGAGLSEVGHRAAGGLAAVGELATAGTPGLSHLAVTRPASEAIEASRDENREFYGAPTTPAGLVANVGSQLTGEAALTMAGGRALQAVAPALAPSAGAGALERFGKGMAANTLASLPVDLGQAVDPATSLTSLAAEHTEAPILDEMASTFPGRAVGEMAASALLSVAPEAFVATRESRRVRGAAQAARQAGQAQTVAEALARRQGLIDQSDQVVRERAAATEGLPLVEPMEPVARPRVQGPEAPAIPPELEGLPLVGEGPAGVPLIGDRPIGVGETPRPRPTPVSEVPPAYTPATLPKPRDDQLVRSALRERQQAAKAARGVEPTAEAPTLPAAPVAPQPQPGGAVEALRRRRLARNLPDLDPVALEEVAAARREAAQARIEQRAATRAANTDPLTGIGNRRALDAALPRAEADPEMAVISFDANNFGKVNKALGNEAGDQALKDVADAIRRVTDDAGAGFRVFRRGGDEFVVLAPTSRAEEIRTAIENGYGARRYGDVEVSLSGSVGPTFEAADVPLQARKAARKAIQAPSTERAAPPVGLGEAGTASHRVLAPLAGGSAGAAIGAATAEPDRRGEGAFKGFVGGVVAGHLSSTVFARRAGRPKAAPVDVSGMYVGRQVALPRAASQGLVGTAGRAYQDLLDHVFAAREFGRKVGRSNLLSFELERGMSWHGQADTYLGRQGQEGPTLARALKMAEGRAEDVTNLLRGERALELHARAQGSAAQLDLPEGISAKGFDIPRTQQAVRDLRAIPEVAAAADAYREFYRRLLDERLANRLIDPDQYRRLVAAGEYYTPFLRDYGGDEFAQAVKSTQSEVQRGTGLRELNVDEIARAPLRDPFALAVFDAQKTARDIARQRVTNVLTDIIAEHPEAARRFIEEVPLTRLKEMTPGQRLRANIQEFNVDGVKRFYAVHDGDLRRALEHAAPLTQNIGMKILQAAKTIKRVGVTIVPEFGLTNAQKDLVFTANQYPVNLKKIVASGLTGAAAGALLGDEDRRGMNALKGFGFGVGAGALTPHLMRTMSALGEVLGESKGFQRWLREGGGNTGFYLKSEEDAQRLIRRLRGDNYTVGEILHPRTWWQALEQLQGAVEQAPRYARYKYLRARGAGAAEAVAGGHNVSVNFLRHGGDPTVQGLGKVTAFWNANLQGKAKLWRDLGVGRNAAGKFRLRNPKAWALGAMAITAPTVALWMQNKDDPAYWDIPLWERNLFWHIPVGQHENGRTKFVKLAKPFELGYLFASVPERFLDYLHQRDPRRLQQALGQMASGTFVDQMVPIPDIAQPTLDVTTTDRGYSRFTGRPVESQAMGRLPAAERSDERTSFPAKAIGERLGVSPTKIDYWWRQTTGTLGRDVADVVTGAARRLGFDDRAPTEPRGPLDRFRTRAAGFSSDPVEQLYLRHERAQQAKTAVRTASSDEEARRLYEQYQDDFENLEAMEDAVAALADARKELRAVQANRTMPLAERRKLEQQIQDYVVDIARSVVDAPALQGAPE